MTGREQMPEHRDCGTDAAAYVLGALESDEAAAFRAHLATCVVCRDEVSAFQAAADALPLLAPLQPVPRSLRRRVMTSVRAEPRGSSAPLRRRWTAPLMLMALPRPALVASAVLLAVAIVIGGVKLASGGGGARVIAARVAWRPGSAVLRVAGGRGELLVRGMPAPPRGEVYEVWLQRRRQPPTPTSALFSVTSTGSGAVDVPGDLHGVSDILVTPERSGGSHKPTHAAVIDARLS